VSIIFGISCTQVVHHVAQKLTSTTLPRRSEVEKFLARERGEAHLGAAERGESAIAARNAGGEGDDANEDLELHGAILPRSAMTSTRTAMARLA
jgi:hypothetical protein